MFQAIVFFIALVVLIALVVKRSQVSKDRKAVSARITEERKEMGDYSPTAALFREAGVMLDATTNNLGTQPITDPSPAANTLDTGAPTTPANAAPRVPHPDLLPPAGLAPLSVFDATTFITEAPSAVVRAGLETEFERLGLQACWVQPTVAETLRGDERGLITIYPEPALAVDADGDPLFPPACDDRVIVRMLAL